MFSRTQAPLRCAAPAAHSPSAWPKAGALVSATGIGASAPWQQRAREAAQGTRGLPLLRAGWAERKPQRQKQLGGAGRSRRPKGASRPPSSANTWRKVRLTWGSHAFPRFPPCQVCSEGPAGRADHPKRRAWGLGGPAHWAGRRGWAGAQHAAQTRPRQAQGKGPAFRDPVLKNRKGAARRAHGPAPDAHVDPHTHTPTGRRTLDQKLPQQVLVAPLVKN